GRQDGRFRSQRAALCHERSRRGSARRGWSAATSEGWSNLRPKPWHGASKGRDVRSGNLFTTHAGGLDAEHESAGRSTAASTWDGTALCHSERSLGRAHPAAPSTLGLPDCGRAANAGAATQPSTLLPAAITALPANGSAAIATAGARPVRTAPAVRTTGLPGSLERTCGPRALQRPTRYPDDAPGHAPLWEFSWS